MLQSLDPGSLTGKQQCYHTHYSRRDAKWCQLADIPKTRQSQVRTRKRAERTRRDFR